MLRVSDSLLLFNGRIRIFYTAWVKVYIALRCINALIKNLWIIRQLLGSLIFLASPSECCLAWKVHRSIIPSFRLSRICSMFKLGLLQRVSQVLTGSPTTPTYHARCVAFARRVIHNYVVGLKSICRHSLLNHVKQMLILDVDRTRLRSVLSPETLAQH